MAAQNARRTLIGIALSRPVQRITRVQMCLYTLALVLIASYNEAPGRALDDPVTETILGFRSIATGPVARASSGTLLYSKTSPGGRRRSIRQHLLYPSVLL